MKIINKLKSFFKRNKNFIGMWQFFMNLFLATLPPYEAFSFVQLVFALVFLLVWQKESECKRLEDQVIEDWKIIRRIEMELFELKDKYEDVICRQKQEGSYEKDQI